MKSIIPSALIFDTKELFVPSILEFTMEHWTEEPNDRPCFAEIVDRLKEIKLP
jgi:hypothetical protein